MVAMDNTDTLDMDRLLLIAGGHTAFQLLWAGIELGVFDLLSQRPGLMLNELAECVELDLQPARILLVGLVALGLVVKSGERYRNAKLTENVLVAKRDSSIAPILGWQAHIVYPGLMDFVNSLRKNTNLGLERFAGQGATIYQRLVANPNLEATFQRSMRALSMQARASLIDAVDFSAYHHLVDVGGGDGSTAIMLAQRYPDLKLTVFDSHSICSIAEKNIMEANLQGRVKTQAGDMFRDPFPENADAILFAHIFTIWSLEKNRQLLEKSYHSLCAGGVVLVFNMMANDEDTGPLSTALGSPYFLAIATGEGMLYSWKDHEYTMSEVGFTSTTRIGNLPLDHGILIGKK